jgi:deoxyadenosine/deoxycytidine kinase
MKLRNLNSDDSSVFIHVCGGIASGKTTLSQLLGRLEFGQELEDFQSNPFWAAFYKDPAWHSFETEITFLLQHFHQTKVASSKKCSFVSDYSLFLDLAYADVTLSGKKKELFLALYNQLLEELPTPSLLLYLRCSPDTQLERIRKRGRDVENAITIDYLTSLNQALEHRIASLQDVNLIVIDSDKKDFKDNLDVQVEVLDAIQEALKNQDYRNPI